MDNINQMKRKTASNQTIVNILLLCLTLLALVISGWQPYDRATWLMEVAPVLIAIPVMWLTYKNFPLTPLLYWCIFFHALVLILGGAYTYARVPAGFWVQELFDLSRNPYDKLGHFVQGFVPALIAREILVRQNIVQGKKMLAFLVVCVVLAISATYELIEWAAALLLGQGADEFLGMQGDPWDTQSDMFLALIGGLVTVLFFSKIHDTQLSQLATKNSLPPIQ